MKNVEEYLKHYRELEKEKGLIEEDLEEAIDRYHHIAEELLNPVDFARVKSSKTNNVADQVYEAVVKISELYGKQVKRIEQRLRKIDLEQREITELVEKSKLSEYEKLYVLLRYFKGFRVDGVVKKLQYSEAQVRRVRVKALKKIEACLNTKDERQ